MNPLLFNAIILALLGSEDWKEDKFKAFFHDIDPLICKQDVTYVELCPIYDKYIHGLDNIDVILKEIEK